MSDEGATFEVSKTIRRWQKKRGFLLMMLHTMQKNCGFVPREFARELADATDVPSAGALPQDPLP